MKLPRELEQGVLQRTLHNCVCLLDWALFADAGVKRCHQMYTFRRMYTIH